MTVCLHPGCPAAQELDQFGRRVSVEWPALMQQTLDARSIHLLNRVIDRTIEQHLRGYTDADKQRTADNVDRELRRIDTLCGHLNELREALRS